MTRTILHLSHSGLPDARIERISVSLKSCGQSFFLGPPGRRTTLFPDSFNTKIYTRVFSPAGNLGLPFYYRYFLRRLAKAIRYIAPDLIYAHNIIAAKAAKDLSLPFVYDDHEYWSRQAMLQRIGYFSPTVRLRNVVRYFLATRLWRKWEAEVLAASIANVTVSEAIAKEHRKRDVDCFVIPNVPLLRELKHLSTPATHYGALRAISLASDFQGFLEHRHPGDHLKVWEKEGGIIMDWVGRPPLGPFKWIKYRQWIAPDELLGVLTSNYQIGFIPWTKNWYHRYSLPSKTAWYAHAGLLFLLSNDYYSLIDFLPEDAVFQFDGSADLAHTLRIIRSLSPETILAKRLNLQDWARENAVLDKYSPTLERIVLRSQRTS